MTAIQNNCLQNEKCRETIEVGMYITSAVSYFALLIIGSIGAAGILPGSTVGWATLGLSAGSYGLLLGAPLLVEGKLNIDFKRFKFIILTHVFAAATILTIGTLGGVGVLSATQTGWGVVGTYLSLVAVLSLPVAAKIIIRQYSDTPIRDREPPLQPNS